MERGAIGIESCLYRWKFSKASRQRLKPCDIYSSLKWPHFLNINTFELYALVLRGTAMKYIFAVYMNLFSLKVSCFIVPRDLHLRHFLVTLSETRSIHTIHDLSIIKLIFHRPNLPHRSIYHKCHNSPK
jgi:hypothetical protein